MKSLGAIESFTGGLFASTIVNRPGASKYFKGSIVLYQNEMKKKFQIDISKGVINAATALMMNKIGRDFLKVDLCVSFTGNAGPIALEGKPPGNVFIAINDKVYEFNFKGSRNEVRQQAVSFAIKEIDKLRRK